MTMGYLKDFRDRLRRFEGGLVRVADVRHERSKEYFGRLARAGAVERVAWGWYYVPSRRRPTGPLEFLSQDRNVKVVTGQTAASFWNGDFVHREVISVAVKDASYARALEAFAESRGWHVEVEVDAYAEKIPHKKVGRLRVEDREHAIVDCMRRWAFVDAVATMSPRLPWERMLKEAYWSRVSGTDVRVGQALEYAAHRLYDVGRDVKIADDYVREELDEAIERVREFGS